MFAEETYQILEEIGRGGMSVVYKVEDLRDHKIYAMKTVRERQDGEKQQSQRIRLAAEAELMRHLDHPAIPGIHEILEDQDQICLVMEYVDGISLSELLQEKGAVEEAAVIEWGKQLCQVLSYLHEEEPPVVYRDLKPANLMLTEDNRIHLIDFGAAGKTGPAKRTRVWGTRGYAAPEQYAGYTDPRSDLYGLGITLCQLVTGQEPVEGRNQSRGRNCSGGSAELQAVLRRCTARRLADRYPDCRSLYQDLDRIGEKEKTKKRTLFGDLMWMISVSAVIWCFWQIWSAV